MEASAGNSILDFETLFSSFRELLNGSGLRTKGQSAVWNCSSIFSAFYYTSRSPSMIGGSLSQPFMITGGLTFGPKLGAVDKNCLENFEVNLDPINDTYIHFINTLHSLQVTPVV